MRAFIDGNGDSSTAAVLTYLSTHKQLKYADLYVIRTGPTFLNQYLDRTFLLTSWPSKLTWSYKGEFVPARLTRGTVDSTIGLEAATLDITWSCNDTDILATDGSGNVLTALQGFTYGIFDNGTVELWRCLMPTAGNCNTLGACLMFSGRIGDLELGRLGVKMSVMSRMELLNEQVPTNLIEPTNIFSQYAISTDFSEYSIVAGSTRNKIFGDGTDTPADNRADGAFNGGHIVFRTGQLAGLYRSVYLQQQESGHFAFYFYEPLPFLPAVDDLVRAYVPVPRDIVSGDPFAGFPYVPSPMNSAVII